MGLTFNPLIFNGLDMHNNTPAPSANTTLSNLTDPTALNASLNFGNGLTINDSSQTPAIDPNARQLYDSGGALSMDWSNDRSLNDSGEEFSLDYENRLLYNGNGVAMLDWSGTDSLTTGKTFRGPAGTAGTPTFGFTTDNGMGLYRTAANKMGLSISSALQIEFAINGFGGGNINIPSELSVPAVISGGSNTAPAFFNATFGAISSLYSPTFCAVGVGANSGQFFGISHRGTVAAPSASLSGDRLGSFWTFGYGTSTFGITATQINALATETFSNTGHGAKLVFQTTPNASTTPTTALTLEQNQDVTINTGNLLINTVGKGLRVKEGTNAKQGVSTLVAGTITVANTSVTASSRIFLTAQSLGTVAVPQALAVTARTAGTSFVITSATATDTSVIAWELFEPA